MTLQEIFDIINANILANGGTLKLAPQTISSPEITELFDKYLLNSDLIVDEASVILNSANVTVSGNGNSLIFFNTEINSLVFTVNDEIPSMSVNADAVIKDEDGWTFGKSFPILKFSNWGGFFDPGDPTKWIQYIFFNSAGFSLSPAGLNFSGFLKLIDELQPLTVLFGLDQVEVKGAVTLNKGEDGFVADTATVVPEMLLIGKIGTIDISLGSFPTFTLEFSMNASAYIITKGDDKGKPVPVLEILIESTIPINDEKIGIAIVVGTQAGSLTMRAILPENEDVGISELIALANNENLLAIMPSNIPVIYDFIVKDWQLTFNTNEKTLSQVAIEVATRDTFSWTLIPGFLTLKSVSLYMLMAYQDGKFSPSLTIEGTIPNYLFVMTRTLFSACILPIQGLSISKNRFIFSGFTRHKHRWCKTRSSSKKIPNYINKTSMILCSAGQSAITCMRLTWAQRTGKGPDT
jgi:hypothetical protein